MNRHAFLALLPCILCIAIQNTTVDLQSAISAAPESSILELAPGTYLQHDLHVNKSLTIRGLQGASSTIIDAQGLGRVFVIDGPDVHVTLDGVQVKNGVSPFVLTAASQSATARRRERLRRQRLPRAREQATWRPKEVVVAVYSLVLDPLSGEMRLVQRPEKKRARPSKASQVEHRTLRDGPAEVPVDQHGGCIFVLNGARLTMTGGIVRGGQAARGAGVACWNAGEVAISGTLFEENVANTIGQNIFTAGAGLYVWGSPSVRIQSSVFSRNQLLCDAEDSTITYGETDQNIAFTAGAGFNLVEVPEVVVQDVKAVQNSMIATQALTMTGGVLFIVHCTQITFSHVDLSENYLSTEMSYISGIVEVQVASHVSFSGISFRNNTIVSGGTVICGCLSFTDPYKGLRVNVSDVSIIGNRVVSASTITAGSVRFSDSISVVATNMTIRDNVYESGGSVRGAAVYVGGCESATLSNIEIRNLVVSGGAAVATSSDGRYVETPGQCGGVSYIYQAAGSLSDGSGDANYANSQLCTFELKAKLALLSHEYYVLSFTQLEIEDSPDCSYDSVTLYDGPTTLSPLIGAYCGFLPTPTCASGECPDVSRVTSSSNVILIVFKSDEDVNYGGFSLNWTTLPQPALSSSQTPEENMLVLHDSSLGGGIFILLSSVMLENVTIRNISLSHPQLVEGGGVYAQGSRVNMSGSVVITNNTISGLVTGGAGIAIMDQAVATVLGSVVCESNLARGVGDCFSAFGSVYCGASWGGGIVVSGGELSVASARATVSVRWNGAACQTESCIAYGGGVAVVAAGQLRSRDGGSVVVEGNQAARGGAIYVGQNSSLDVSSGLVCRRNRAACLSSTASASRTCGWVGGGCVLTVDGAVSLVGAAIAENSVVGADGGGGGCIASTGASRVTAVRSSCVSNSAPEGGAVWGDESTNITLIESTIARNRAGFVGGGVSARGSTALLVQGSHLVDNTAVRASEVWGYGDHTNLVFVGSDATDQTGVTVLVLGQVSSSSSIQWSCTQPGSVLQSEESASFYSQTCYACPAGTYNVYNGSSERKNDLCHSCPFGGVCTGSSSSSSGLRALPVYWGHTNASGFVSFYVCPPSYCCPPTSAGSCDRYDHCDGNRVGPLCGQCPPSMGFRFFSEACGYDDDCTDGAWAYPVLVVFSMAIALYLAFGASHEEDSGLRSVALFFYQVVGLVKSSQWQYTNSSFFATVQSISTMSPVGSGGRGVCFAPGMTALGKVSSRIVFPGVVFASFGFICVVHFLVHFGGRLASRLQNKTAAPVEAIAAPRDAGDEVRAIPAWDLASGASNGLGVSSLTLVPVSTPGSPRETAETAREEGVRRSHVGDSRSINSVGSSDNLLEPRLAVIIDDDSRFEAGAGVDSTVSPSPLGAFSSGASDGAGSTCELQGAGHGLSSPQRRTFLGHVVSTMLSRPDAGVYTSSFVHFLNLSYISLTLAAVQLLQCQPLDGKLMWWFDSSIECYQRFQWGASVMLAVLFPFPLCVVLFLLKYKPRRGTWQEAIAHSMNCGYRDNRKWWEGVSLYRELLVVLGYALTTDSIWRAMGLGILMVTFLVLNLLAHPFKSTIAHRLETVSLFLLALLSISTTPQLSKLQLKSDYPVENEVTLEWLQMLAFVFPGVACGVPYSRELFLKWSGKARRLHRRLSSGRVAPASVAIPVLPDVPRSETPPQSTPPNENGRSRSPPSITNRIRGHGFPSPLAAIRTPGSMFDTARAFSILDDEYKNDTELVNIVP